MDPWDEFRCGGAHARTLTPATRLIASRGSRSPRLHRTIRSPPPGAVWRLGSAPQPRRGRPRRSRVTARPWAFRRGGGSGCRMGRLGAGHGGGRTWCRFRGVGVWRVVLLCRLAGCQWCWFVLVAGGCVAKASVDYVNVVRVNSREWRR